MKLQPVIDSHGLQMGDTEDGRAWCLKALHPASPIVECRGIPDESAVPSAFLNYQSTYTFAPAVGATGTWQFDAALLPHPINFLFLNKTDSTGNALVSHLNTQLLGATHELKMASFLGFAQRWRLAYMSVTVYQDGPALADQGTLAAVQAVSKPTTFCFSGLDVPGTGLACFPPVAVFDNLDPPSFAVMQNLPNAYLNRSKEGLYLPLKMTRTHQAWKSQSDLIMHTSVQQTAPAAGIVLATAATATGRFPHPDLLQAAYNPGVLTGGSQTSPFCNDTLGFFSVRNAAVTSQFTVYVRSGWEIQCQPGTPYTPQLALSPRCDDRAMATYFHIARELKDGYPADFNDLGKIWDVIKGVIKTIAPGLSAIPMVGPALSAAAPFVVSAGDKIGELIRSASSKKAKACQSAADLERERAKLRKQMGPKPGQVAAITTVTGPGGAKRLLVERRPRK